MTYSACLVNKVEADVLDRQRAIPGGAYAAGERNTGKLPDVETSEAASVSRPRTYE